MNAEGKLLYQIAETTVRGVSSRCYFTQSVVSQHIKKTIYDYVNL